MATKTKDNLQVHVFRLLKKYKGRCGCTTPAAIRDLLTDIMHICRFEVVDFDERVQSAREVYDQEVEEDIHQMAEEAGRKVREDTQ
jgi:hypothetical protein